MHQLRHGRSGGPVSCLSRIGEVEKMRGVIRDSWDRQKGESSKVYGLFQAYRDLGRDRSLALLHRQLAERTSQSGQDGKTTVKRRQLERNSVRHRWVDRCEAYDIHLDQLRRKQTEKE